MTRFVKIQWPAYLELGDVIYIISSVSKSKRRRNKRFVNPSFVDEEIVKNPKGHQFVHKFQKKASRKIHSIFRDQGILNWKLVRR